MNIFKISFNVLILCGVIMLTTGFIISYDHYEKTGIGHSDIGLTIFCLSLLPIFLSMIPAKLEEICLEK